MTKKKKPEDKLKVGRPEIMSEAVVKKFLDGFRMGFNDSECCAYCEISRQTYYTFVNQNPDFLDKVNEAKEYPFLKAKNTIFKNLEKPDTAKWYLEKKRRDEFGDVKRVELETSDKFSDMTTEEKARILIEKAKGKK